MYGQPWSSSPPIASPFFSKCRHTIEVTGEGTVSATPTKAIIVLGVITEKVSLAEAQKENANAITNIVNALVELSIPKEHIQTTHYSIDIQYNNEDGKQVFRGYQVTHLLQLTIDQINQTGLVVDTAVMNGANNVSNIRFTLAHPEIAYKNALSLAIKDSLLKAMNIAQTLGVTLHPAPCLVQETSRSQEPIPFSAISYSTSAATPIQPGELKIVASIKAEFTYY
ncbi:SIMPL domain-containing protein [Paenibacillus planticolens]|uniref:DUF541 domain-containing protein n=1 Tax=Paenibacillus planticolens TaxID=2654976 RepID=A0ABX1ZJE1_9BACL|nr:SIMPL domain-containing protein [Paenibacillus planticolens]NOU98769.1 DUF541 domain-containing protein [Paenibacillus planticolens]